MMADLADGFRVIYDVIPKGDLLVPHVIRTPWAMGEIFRQLQTQGVIPVTREAFGIFLLDSRNQIIGWHTVSVGILDRSLVHPREVFGPAMRLCALGIITVHNHTSDSVQPSPEDLSVFRRLDALQDITGINVVDHLIISNLSNDTYSYRRGKQEEKRHVGAGVLR